MDKILCLRKEKSKSGLTEQAQIKSCNKKRKISFKNNGPFEEKENKKLIKLSSTKGGPTSYVQYKNLTMDNFVVRLGSRIKLPYSNIDNDHKHPLTVTSHELNRRDAKTKITLHDNREILGSTVNDCETFFVLQNSSVLPVTSSSQTESLSVLNRNDVDTAMLEGCHRNFCLFSNGRIMNPICYDKRGESLRCTQTISQPLHFCFDSFFNTYTNVENQDDGEYLTDDFHKDSAWFLILSLLEESVSDRYFPSMIVLRSMLKNGVLMHPNEAVRQQCAFFVRRLVVFQHPPNSNDMVLYYLRIFSRHVENSGFGFDPLEPWEYLWDIMSKCIDCLELRPKENFTETPGEILLLELVTLIIEIQLNSWSHSDVQRLTLSSSFPMIVRIFWPNEYPVKPRVNCRVRQLIGFYARSLACDRGEIVNSVVRSLRILVSLVARVISLTDTKSNCNDEKNLFADVLFSALAVSQREFLRNELFLIGPAWLGILLAFRFINVSRLRSNETQLNLRDLLKAFRGEDMIPVQESVSCFQSERKRKIKSEKSRKYYKRNEYGETLLHIACKKGNVARVKELLAQCNSIEFLNSQDNYGWTALHEACVSNHVECVKALLAYRPTTLDRHMGTAKVVNISSPAGDEHETPLHEAVFVNAVESVAAIFDAVVKDPELFPSLDSLLAIKNSSGKDVKSLSCSPEMSSILQRTLVCPKMRSSSEISTQPKWIFTWLISRYISYFQLPFIRQQMLVRKRKLSHLRFETCSCNSEEFLKEFEIFRSLEMKLKDIRTFYCLLSGVNTNQIDLPKTLYILFRD